MTNQQALIACEHCASIYLHPRLNRGESAHCRRCRATLWRYCTLSVSHWLALAITTTIVFVVANAYPVAHLSVQGIVQQSTLLDAIVLTWRQGRWFLALITGLASFALPLCQLVLLVWVLWPLTRGRAPASFGGATRLLGALGPWSMVGVFLLGVVVAMVKLAGLAAVSPGLGLGAFGVLTVLLTMLGRLSPKVLWRYAEVGGVVAVHRPPNDPAQKLCGCKVCGQVQAWPGHSDAVPPRCRRCNAILYYRKPHSLTRMWALLLAAVILYIPANALPVMQVSSLRGEGTHTILGGVAKLWESGSWDIALIVFVASVVVPLIKLLTLAVLAVATQRDSRAYLRQRTRLYEMLEFIGQWSMLDLFVVILLASLARFQGLMEIRAGAGAAVFGLVVILTVLATMSFDPRHAWEAKRQSATKLPLRRSGGRLCTASEP